MKKTHPDSHDPRFGEPEQPAASHEPKHEREPAHVEPSKPHDVNQTLKDLYPAEELKPPHGGRPNDELARLQAENAQLRADVEHLQRQLVAPVAPVAPVPAPEPAGLAIKNRRPNR